MAVTSCCTGIHPTTLLNSRIGRAYSQSISGLCPELTVYTITLFSGTLPTGLVFTEGSNLAPAMITGTPTTAGVFNFSVKLSSIACVDIFQEYTITIRRKVTGGGAVGGVPFPSQDIFFNIAEFDSFVNSVIEQGFPANSPLLFNPKEYEVNLTARAKAWMVNNFKEGDTIVLTPAEATNLNSSTRGYTVQATQSNIYKAGETITLSPVEAKLLNELKSNINRGTPPSEITYSGIPYQYAGIVGNTYKFTQTSNQRTIRGSLLNVGS